MATVVIERLDGEAASAALDELAGLLRDAVEGGASVGFTVPFEEAQNRGYWTGVCTQVAAGRTRLLGAREDARLVGTVQLVHPFYPNGRHRAEVSKLLVHSSAQRRGIGRLLMEEADRWAMELALKVLYLDTATGSGAEGFYQDLGWTRVGEIPLFCTMPDGALCGTTIYHRQL